jgi:glutamate--cysteine ligase catalytic subunit
MPKEVARLFIILAICAVLEVVSSFTLKMGLLKVGVPMKWDDSKKNLQYIRKAGVRQFVSTYNRVKDLKGDELLWGDEIEYGVFCLDPENKKIRLSLRAKEVSTNCANRPSLQHRNSNMFTSRVSEQIMDELNQKEEEHSQISEGCNWVGKQRISSLCI